MAPISPSPETYKKTQWMFEIEPMNGKPVTCIPGIGTKWGIKLQKLGIEQADQLFGHWLRFHKDGQRFGSWLKRYLGCTQATVNRILNAFEEYTSYFL